MKSGFWVSPSLIQRANKWVVFEITKYILHKLCLNLGLMMRIPIMQADRLIIKNQTWLKKNNRKPTFHTNLFNLLASLHMAWIINMIICTIHYSAQLRQVHVEPSSWSLGRVSWKIWNIWTLVWFEALAEGKRYLALTLTLKRKGWSSYKTCVKRIIDQVSFLKE